MGPARSPHGQAGEARGDCGVSPGVGAAVEKREARSQPRGGPWDHDPILHFQNFWRPEPPVCGQAWLGW